MTPSSATSIGSSTLNVKPMQSSASTKAIVTKKLASTGPISLNKPNQQRYGAVHLQSSVKDLWQLS